LSFNLYSSQTLGWTSPLIICLLVFGLLLLVAFDLYEKLFAPKAFLPYVPLMDGIVMGVYI
jgi:hypothetical protein